MHADTHCHRVHRRPSLVHGPTGDPLPPPSPEAPHATVRLSRLSQGRADAHLDIGWLIELELDPTEPLLAGDRLAQALRDMRLLGLQATLLAPSPPASHTNGQAA